MTTLVADLQIVKPYVAAGDLRTAALVMAGYTALKPTLARRAKARIPAMVFNNHPRFTAFGSRLLHWPEDERHSWAAQIERGAADPDRLPGLVDLAADAAAEALKDR